MAAVDKSKLKDAIELLSTDLNELESCLSNWDSESLSASRKYRSIAKRIVLSAQRLRELVTEYTYSNWGRLGTWGRPPSRPPVRGPLLGWGET